MISFGDAKNHLRVDFDDENENADITAKLLLARAIIADYLGIPTYPPELVAEDFATEGEFLTASEKAAQAASVADAATLLVLGELYANRESPSDPLSKSVKALLERLRFPGIA